MKSAIAYLLIIALNALGASAQGVFSNQTNSALQKVIADYPNKFSNIRGERINSSQQTNSYYSKVEVPGSSANIITLYNNQQQEAYGWKSEIFESDNFNTARERFKEAFDNIRNTIIKIEGMSPFILNGKYEYPSEEKNSTTISFNLLPASGEVQKLKVELSLRRVSSGWKITLAVAEQEAIEQEALLSSNY